MKIHPLWTVCLLVRSSLAYIINQYGNKSTLYRYILTGIIFVIGAGFIHKGLVGSNNETQISKVFWHETRYGHGILYLLATIYLYNKRAKLSSVFILTDIAYSIFYRILFKK